jgi:hypothetical protein
MRFYLGDIRHALLLLWTTLLCSRILQALVTGGEPGASSIFMVLFVPSVLLPVLRAACASGIGTRRNRWCEGVHLRAARYRPPHRGGAPADDID